MKHLAFVKNGKLEIANKDNFKKNVRELEDKQVFIFLSERKKKRSLNQNAYYWGVVVDMLAEHLGYFPEEIHEVLKQKFLPKKEIQIMNKNVIIPESTTQLSTKAFEDYTEKIRVWAALELNFVIPDPRQIENP